MHKGAKSPADCAARAHHGAAQTHRRPGAAAGFRIKAAIRQVTTPARGQIHRLVRPLRVIPSSCPSAHRKAQDEAPTASSRYPPRQSRPRLASVPLADRHFDSQNSRTILDRRPEEQLLHSGQQAPDAPSEKNMPPDSDTNQQREKEK